MKFDLSSVLIDPYTSQKIYLTEDLRTLHYEDSKAASAFEVKDGIPVILPPAAPVAVASASSAFDYIAHYQKDSVAFDYFKEYDDPATNHENRRLHEAILNELPNQCDTILDVGCGNGWVAGAQLKQGKTVVSFDIAFNNVKKVLASNSSPAHFGVVGDVLALPFKEASFDVVISAEVIEHVLDVNRYIANILRVLKPGGRAIISTPYKEKIQYSLCIHCNNMTPHNAHLRSFDENSLDPILAQKGFSLRSISLSSKVLLYARSHKLLQFLPFNAWRLIDKATNLLIKKPSRLIYVIEKNIT